MKKRFYAVLFSLIATTVITLNVAPIILNNDNNPISQSNQTTEQDASKDNQPILPRWILEGKDDV